MHRAYLFSTLMVAVALGVGLIIDYLVDVPNISLLFLVAVLGAAMIYGLLPSLYAALLGIAAYNFFFLPPIYTFSVADPANAVALVVFGLVAVLSSHLAAVSRNRLKAARHHARTMADLQAFSSKLVGIGNLETLLKATTHQIRTMLGFQAAILMPAANTLTVRYLEPSEQRLSESDLAAARWAWDHDRPTGRGANTFPGAHWLFLPMRTERDSVAVLGITSHATSSLPPTDEERRLIESLANQAAVAIERIMLARDVDRAHLLAETERLRSALLNSLSHDLRTPLSSILTAATSLQRHTSIYDESVRTELAITIQNEAERMTRFVNNLLAMTRIESGALAPKREIVDLADTVGIALQAMGRLLDEHRLMIDIPADLPMINCDGMLLEQVIRNLLDNAAKYATSPGTIVVKGCRVLDRVVITVIDEGPGIPSDRLTLIFDKFHRVQVGDRQRAGTGLGLAICRAFVEAMGGVITAANRSDRSGAVFTVNLPAGLEMPSDPEAEPLR